MKKVMMMLMVFISAAPLMAQKSIERITIQGGSSAWENFYREIYRYPSFETGLVEYKDGRQFKGLLNYNKVLGTIQFIDEKGDTLAMNNEDQIKMITIGNDEFFYVLPDCMEEVKDGGKVKLVKNERIRIADKQKVGGMGITNTTGTIESIDRLDTKVNYNQVDINEKLLLSKTTKFYLETGNNELIPASKKNVLSLFSKHEGAIKEYIKKNNVDFTREDDLAELTGYLSQL